MKIYVVNYTNEHSKNPTSRRFFGSEREAATFRRSVRRMKSCALHSTDIVDVPTKKRNLVMWLNDHASTH